MGSLLEKKLQAEGTVLIEGPKRKIDLLCGGNHTRISILRPQKGW